jgi:multiple sugar transport system substrate-binding protein
MKEAADFDWRIAVPPAPEDGSFVGALGGFNLGVNAKSKSPDLAFQWVEFMAQPENQLAVNSLIPALKASGEEFAMANRVQPEVVLETLRTGSPRPLSPVYPAISQAQQDAVQAIIAGEPVDKAVKKAHDAINEALKELE